MLGLRHCRLLPGSVPVEAAKPHCGELGRQTPFPGGQRDGEDPGSPRKGTGCFENCHPPTWRVTLLYSL